MVLICLGLGLVSLGISLPACRALIGSGRGLDEPGTESHKRHARATPNTGGIALFLAIALPMAGATAAAWTGYVPETVQPHVEGLRRQTPMMLAILAAMAVLHALGLIDDRRRLGPWTKLAVESALALALALFFQMRVLEFLGPVSVAVSALWIVVIINAMNMLDNMDGLSAGVGAVAAGIYLAATLAGGQWFVAALSALLLGALLGFLVFNFPPARIFMGDGGSLLLGLLLAVVSIRTTYLRPDQASDQWFAVLMPVVVLAVPLYDLVSVTLIRLRAGRSPLVGDQNHFSHRLVRRGHSGRSAVLVIWLATAATGLGGLLLTHLQGPAALLAAAQCAAVLAMVALLERGR